MALLLTLLIFSKFENKLACELVYVLGINRSYLVKEGNNQFYEVLESDDAFGKLIPGQTIYLNNISSYFCEYFSLNKNDFRFEYSNNDDNYDYRGNILLHIHQHQIILRSA